MMQVFQLHGVDSLRVFRPQAHGHSFRISASAWETDESLQEGLDYCKQRGLPFMVHPMAGRRWPAGPELAAESGGAAEAEAIRWDWCSARPHQAAAWIPNPWDRNYQEELVPWVLEVADYAASYANGLVAIHWPGPRESSEWFVAPEQKTTNRDEVMVWVEPVIRVAMASDFPIIVDWSSHFPAFALELLERANVWIQHNSLGAHTKPGASHHQAVLNYNGQRGFQTVGSVKRAGPTAKWMAKAKQAGAKWLEVYAKQVASAVRLAA